MNEWSSVALVLIHFVLIVDIYFGNKHVMPHCNRPKQEIDRQHHKEVGVTL